MQHNDKYFMNKLVSISRALIIFGMFSVPKPPLMEKRPR